MGLTKRPLAAAAVLLLAGCGQLPGAIEAPASSPGLEVQSRSSEYQKKDSPKRANSNVVAVTVQVGDYNNAVTQAGNGNTGIIQVSGPDGQIVQVGQVNGANSASYLLGAAVLQSNTQALVTGDGWGGGQFAQISQPIQQVGTGPQLAAPQAGIQQVDGAKARFAQRSRNRQL